MGQKIIVASAVKGVSGTALLLIFYFATVTLISGWDFAQGQFSKYWYLIVVLAFGFGIQVALYFYSRDRSRQTISKKVLATSGGTSAAAMVSCCSHFLANILPIIGISGFITFVTQYQVQFFWVGLALNLAGIAYMSNKVYLFSKRNLTNE